MLGPGHRLTGGVSGFALGLHLGWPWYQTLTSAVMATAMSNGPLSPDGDQTWLRKLGHRKLTHWVEIPLGAGWVMFAVGAPWFAWSLLIGWSSHLAADFVFGRAGWGHGRGVPVLFGTVYVGLGLKAGGAIENKMVTPVVLPAVLGWQVFLLIEPAIRRFR